MERTGGEPDVVGFSDKKTGETFFMIVQRKVLKAAEIFVMNREALEARKEHNPK